MNIAAFKREFDRALARVLDRKLKELSKLTRDPYILKVAKHGCALALQGGKRIRPYIAYISYQAAGGKKKRVIETLVGLELFHTFALVHDDIMDKGEARHGVPTANKMFGDSQAILMGDLLFNWASEIIATSKGQPIFAKMVDEVILGQMLDVDAIRRQKVSDRFIQDKMRLKTASYSFIRPMQFGVALAGSRKQETRSMMKFCESFGLPLGLAFQVQDDLLDLTTSSAKLRKSSMNDIREGQKTVFTQFVSKNTKHNLNKYKDKTLSESDKKKIRKILEESGALQYGRNRMAAYFRKAEVAVEKSDSSDAKRIPFVEIIEYIRSRSH